MKATTLKKKYSDIWDSVYDSVIEDLSREAHTIAHNAAFYACLEYHRKIKKAEEEFERIISSKEETERVVDVYCKFLNEKMKD